MREALTAKSFASLERELDLDVVRCTDCGAWVRPRGLAIHRVTSALCRWRRAVAEVRELWAVGFRDPWSVPEAPLDWASLNGNAAWRRRVHVVTFSRWAAVVLAPLDDAGERGTRLAKDPRKRWPRP